MLSNGETSSTSSYKTLDLTLDNKRLMVNTPQEVQDLLAQLSVDKCQAVKIGTKSYSEEASKHIAKVLASLSSTLVHADLGDIIAGRPEAEALEVLLNVCSSLNTDMVEFVDLSDNALGEKGIRKLEPFLRSASKSVQKWAFANNGLSQLSVELLKEYMSASHTITALKFDNNMSGDGGATQAALWIADSCPLLEEFQMSASRVRKEGGMALSAAFAHCTTLKKLDINDGMFGFESAQLLAQNLPKLVQLEHLVLRDVGISEEGALLVLTALAQHPPKTLKYLDIGLLELSPTTASQVGQCLGVFRDSLQVLSVEENELEAEGISLLLNGMKVMTALKSVNVGLNQITGKGGVYFAQYCAQALPNIQRVNMDGNWFSSRAVLEVKKLLGDKLLPMDENEGDQDLDDLSDLLGAM